MASTLWDKLLSANTIKGVGSILSGTSSYFSSLENSTALLDEGNLSREDYYRQAAFTREAGVRTRAKQAMEYLSSGVEIAGTPQLVLKETVSRAAVQARAYERTGDNILRLAEKKADTTEEEGMSSLISSIITAGAMFLL